MECYICHRLVDRSEYTHHVGSHLAGNNVGMDPQTSATLPTFSYGTVDYHHYYPGSQARSALPRTPRGHDRPLRPMTPTPYDQFQSDDSEDFLPQLVSPGGHQRAHFTPSSSPARTAEVADRVSQQQVAAGLSIQPNAFELWLQNPTRDNPKYTTIDGQRSQPNSQVDDIIQAAEVLRGTTKEKVVKIVNQFEGYSYSDRKTCLELIRKTPIFPGLVAYTYTHLVACPRRRWFSCDDWSEQVSKLKKLIECWSKDDDRRCILSYDTMKDNLLRILRDSKVSPEEHQCNSTLLSGTMVLDCDILNLAALTALWITRLQKDILDECGAQAEKLVGLFHNLLEANVELEEGYRRLFFNALVMVSKKAGCCPPGIYLAKGAVNDLVQEGQGGFGIVYKGKIDDRLVAVKALKRDSCMPLPEYKKQLCKEAIVWRHLRHPNCLPLYGVYNIPTNGPNISVGLVSPWMDQGTLSEYLRHNPEANPTKLILDVVRGLNYLHSMKPHVAHRDIKPDNILVTKKGRACLADFGLISTFDTDNHFHTAPSEVVMGGTWYYMAPEIFEASSKEAKRKVNKRACDMYALGCTIYAAYTGNHPFHQLPPACVPANVLSNKRPEFPEGKISPDMWNFVENLWGPDPSMRLTAQSALGWMEAKAHEEGMDTSHAAFEEEWEWRGDDKCLWSVSF